MLCGMPCPPGTLALLHAKCVTYVFSQLSLMFGELEKVVFICLMKKMSSHNFPRESAITRPVSSCTRESAITRPVSSCTRTLWLRVADPA